LKPIHQYSSAELAVNSWC